MLSFLPRHSLAPPACGGQTPRVIHRFYILLKVCSRSFHLVVAARHSSNIFIAYRIRIYAQKLVLNSLLLLDGTPPRIDLRRQNEMSLSFDIRNSETENYDVDGESSLVAMCSSILCCQLIQVGHITISRILVEFG
jgi:hypothetical protein